MTVIWCHSQEQHVVAVLDSGITCNREPGSSCTMPEADGTSNTTSRDLPASCQQLLCACMHSLEMAPLCHAKP
jgi:hypothetical protein